MNPSTPASPVCRYPVPTLENLPEDIRERILEVQAKAGFVPNVFLALAHRPAEWRAFVAYHDALMLKEGGNLSKGDREMIVVATSAANECLYCVVSHGAILRIYEKKPLVAPGNTPQRLPDGAVFLPKSAQRGMGVLTERTVEADVPKSLELAGRVIMDPHLGGRGQAMRSIKISGTAG